MKCRRLGRLPPVADLCVRLLAVYQPMATSAPRNFSKSAATAVFALIVCLLMRAHGILHWKVLSRHYGEIPESVRPELFAMMSRLVVASHCLFFASLIWCVWSWRTESAAAAVFATVFTVLTSMMAFSMVMT